MWKLISVRLLRVLHRVRSLRVGDSADRAGSCGAKPSTDRGTTNGKTKLNRSLPPMAMR